jgi:hypothetical protein
MVARLSAQLSHLAKDCQRAFELGDEAYLPEVATKLRLLLVRSRANKPLLFEVAAQIGVEPKVTLGGPPLIKREGEIGPGDTITLDQFFDLQAVTIRTSSGLISLTKRELIRAWAEQLGGAHEDWSVDEALVNAIQTPVFIGGMQPTVLELRNCARTALQYGQQIVEVARQSAQPGERSERFLTL